MKHYSKLYSTITGSSIWDESKETKILWITMLAQKDMNGLVELGIGGLAAASRLTRTETREALAVLTAPDPESASPEYEGRRVKKLSNGEWLILNHDKYESLMKTHDRNQRNKERMRAVREKAKEDSKNSPPMITGSSEDCAQSVFDGVPPCSAVAPIAITITTTTTTKKTVDTPQVRTNSEVGKLFEFWKSECGHPKSKLDTKRGRVIANALKSYDAKTLAQAIRGCARNPHNNGSTGGSKYDDVTLIFRDAAHIERFADEAAEPPKPRVVPGAKPALKGQLAKPGER